MLNYYGLRTELRAADFIVTAEELSTQQIVKAEELPRAAVFFKQDTAEECFLGVYFAEDLQRNFSTAVLDNSQLDSFCVLIEELSHFILLTRRLNQQRQVSQLELECQAEIDKCLFAALMLQQQTGRYYLPQLHQLLFTNYTLLNTDAHYAKASRFAEKFWGTALAQGVGTQIPLQASTFQLFMRHNYHQPFHAKNSFEARTLRR